MVEDETNLNAKSEQHNLIDYDRVQGTRYFACTAAMDKQQVDCSRDDDMARHGVGGDGEKKKNRMADDGFASLLLALHTLFYYGLAGGGMLLKRSQMLMDTPLVSLLPLRLYFLLKRQGLRNWGASSSSSHHVQVPVT